MATSPGPTLKSFLIAIVALVITVGFLAGLMWAVSLVPTEVLVTCLIVGLPAGGGLVGIALQKHWDARRQVEEGLRENKERIYSEFIRFWFDSLYGGKPRRKPMTDSELEAALVTFTRDVTLWGSDEVIRRCGEWRALAVGLATGEDETGSATSRDAVEAFESLLFAMRADLGHRNKGLETGNLLCLFINDEPRYFPRPRGPKLKRQEREAA